MQHVTNAFDGPWISHQIPGSAGFNFSFDVLGSEYTDAFSVDLVRVDVGGFSPFHIDPDNHAFFVVDGEAEFVIADLSYRGGPGLVARIPMGVVHQIRNLGDKPLVMLAMYDPPRDREALKAAKAAQP